MSIVTRLFEENDNGLSIIASTTDIYNSNGFPASS